MTWLQTIIHKLIRAPQSDTLRVLAVMRKDSDSQALHDIAARSHWRLEFAPSYQSALDLARRNDFAVILYDRDLGVTQTWRDALRGFVTTVPGSRVILTSRANDDYLWQEVIQLGGYDVITKPFSENKIVRSIEFAATRARVT